MPHDPSKSNRRINYVGRGVGCAVGLTPFALAVASLIVGPPQSRYAVLLFPFTAALGFASVTVACLVTISNAYTAFLRPYLYRRRHGSLEGMRNVSVVPLAGTFFAFIGCLTAFGDRTTAVVALLVLALDVGGFPWAVVCVWRDEGFWGE